ncbi:Endonuclease/exonuclease/phosphatase [Corchorus olitorius]|uniref:Endonuclease/exonuclease/phosphatase n=1 Tax=Corchorus olitorius TaxID=93759 RepID=A0A1R3JHK0_9ROSI|nr:Endonuclease/exonuclease/phosphatase [Corchorus olitorius]
METVVTLPSKPVVGCDMIPHVRVNFKGPPTSPPRPLPPYNLAYNWYREIKKFCSVHPSELATVQCNVCANLGQTYYSCSSKCYKEAWPIHKHSHGNPSTSPNCRPSVLKYDSRQWQWVGSSEYYKPSEMDVKCILKLACVARDPVEGILLTTVNIKETDPVIPFPTLCPRCMIEFGSYQKSHINIETQSSDGFTFSVLSYNILADIYACSGKHNHCPDWALIWEYRKKNLLREIINYSADIICLQEVQSDHFDIFLESELKKEGYSARYKKKKNQMYTSNRLDASDGCAIFYRCELFKEIMKYELEFNQIEDEEKVVENLEPEERLMRLKRLQQDNVALIVILGARKPGSTDDGFQFRICVVTKLIEKLEIIAQSKIPLLICADLNSCPDRINCIPGEKDNPVGICECLKLEHSLDLACYRKIYGFSGITGKANEYTDLILHTDSLKVEGLLELVDSESVASGEGEYLPSPKWSSDHIALMAKFRVKPPSPSELALSLPQKI